MSLLNTPTLLTESKERDTKGESKRGEASLI